MTVRFRQIALPDIVHYIAETCGSAPVQLPEIELCTGAVVLARQDGLFVMRVDTHKGFPVEDVEQLGWVVASIAKMKLGHIHDVHRASRRATKSLLTPSKTLVIYPIRLEPADWAPIFAQTKPHFDDGDLKTARCIMPARAPLGTTTPRLALVTLRRAYLKVFENLSGRLAFDRGQQAAWQAGQWRVLLVALSILVVGALYLVLEDIPTSLADFWSSLQRPKFILALLSIVPAFFIFANFLAQMVRWDTPRIQLLRSATLFYEYANPLNRVLAAALGLEHDGFEDVIALLDTKTEGEVHRTGVHQTWLVIALTFAALMFAALAIRDGETEAAKIARAAAASAHAGEARGAGADAKPAAGAKAPAP